MKSKYPLKKGQIETGLSLMKQAGEFTGTFDVSEGNFLFYQDYVAGTPLTPTLSENKMFGSRVSIRVRGSLLTGLPVEWNLSGDTLSTLEEEFNELTLTYVSDKDVRVENRVVPFVDTIAPSVPENLVSSNITGTSFDIDWGISTDSLGGAVTYNVYNNGTFVENVATNSVSFTGLGEYSLNEITVSSLDIDSNESEQSEVLSVRTLDVTAPTIPQNLVSSDITDISFNITWDNSTDNVGVVSYNVYVDAVLNQNVETNSVSISELVLGTEYSVTVSALDIAANESAQSTPLVVTTSGGVV